MGGGGGVGGTVTELPPQNGFFPYNCAQINSPYKTHDKFPNADKY